MGVYLRVDERQREPSASTTAYWKLNETTQLQDSSGNNHTLTNGGATFGTYNGVSCCSIGGNRLTVSGITPGTQKTVLAWVYIPSGDINRYIWLESGSPAQGVFLAGHALEIANTHPDSAGTTSSIQYITNITGGWNLIATTNDSSNYFLYVYNSSNQNVVNGLGMPKDFSGTFYLGGPSGYSFTGNLSEFIIESEYYNKDKIDMYFNQTKGTYGIS